MAWLDDKKTYQSRIENLQKYFYYFEDDENSAINKLSDDLFIIPEDSDLTEILNGIIKYEVILNRIKSIYRYPYYLVQPSTVVKLGNALRKTLQLSNPDTLGNMISKLSSSGGYWEELYTGYITGSVPGIININTSEPIRDYAFYNFSNITEVSAPNVAGIGKSAFVGCTALKTFYAPEAKTYNKSLDEPDVLQIENFTAGFDLKKVDKSEITYKSWLSTGAKDRLNPGFTKNEHLKTLTLTGVRAIGQQAFEQCTNLTTVNLTRPDLSVQTNTSSSSVSLVKTKGIGSSAFKKCTSLQKINAPYYKTIYNNAFEGCTALTEIEFPEVGEVKEAAFSKCTSLKKVVMPICKKLAADTFKDVSTLEYLDIGVSSIPNIFSKLTNLHTVIMSLATNIAENAFAVPSDDVPQSSASTVETTRTFIQEIQVPALKKIQKKAFYNCVSIPAIIAPQVSEVWDSAFAGCSTLQFAIVATAPIASSKVQDIKTKAFNECGKLKYIICPEVNTLGKNAFKNCGLLSTFYAPKCKTLGDDPFVGMEGLKYLYLGEDKAVEDKFAGCKRVEYLTLPNCKEIGQDTFKGYALKYISIPLCTKIGSSAFYNADSLKRIYLPKIQTISAQAFQNCTQLKNVYLLNSSVVTFGASAFDLQYSGSTNAINFYVPQSLYSNYQTAAPDYSSHFVPVTHTEIPLYDKDIECTKLPIIKTINLTTGNPDETLITFDFAGVGREKYQDGVDEIFTDNYTTGFNLKTYFYKEEKEIKTKAALRDGRNIIYKPDTKPNDSEQILINDTTSFTLMYIPVDDINTTYQIPYARVIVELDKDKNIIATSGDFRNAYHKIYENDIRCEFKPQQSECKYICISFKKCDFSNDPNIVKIYSVQNYGHKTFCYINSDNSTIDGHKFTYVHENETDSDNNTIYKGTYKEEIIKKYLYESDDPIEEAIDHQSYRRIDFNSEIKENKYYCIDDDKGPNRDFSSALKISLSEGIQHNLSDGAIYYQREGTIYNYNKYKSIQFNIDENSIYDYFYKLENEDEIQLDKGATSININDQNIKVYIRETHTSDEVNDNKSFTLLECSKLADVFDNIKLLFEEIQE